MADPTDIESLARRFLDLWQEQVAAMAADPEFVNSAERALGAFTPRHEEGAAGEPSGTSQEAAGTSAAAVSPDVGDDGLRRVERRIAALEDRLAALEARFATGCGGAGGSGRKGEP